MMPIFLWSMLVIQSRHSGPHSLEVGERAEDGDAAQHDPGERDEQDRLVQGKGLPAEAPEQQLA